MKARIFLSMLHEIFRFGIYFLDFLDSPPFVLYCVNGRPCDRWRIRKKISDFRPRLRTSFVRLHQHTGDTSANRRIFRAVSILLLSRVRSYFVVKISPWGLGFSVFRV